MSKKMWKKLSTLLLMVVMVLTMSLSVQAAAVKMNKAKATLYPGQKVTLKVTGTSKKAKWSSSNAKVAKVSKGNKRAGAMKFLTASLSSPVRWSTRSSIRKPSTKRKCVTI